MVSITTVFTPPPSCTSVFTRSGDLVWQGGIVQTGDVDCFPPGFAKILNSFYSPGICPSGWTSAGALTGTGALVFNPQETNVMCCPRGYEMAETIQLQGSSFGGIFCRSTMPPTLTNVFSTSALADGAVPPTASLSTAAASTIANPYVWEDIIQVRWQSTDTQILQLLSASSTTSSTSSSRRLVSGTPTSSSAVNTTAGSPDAPSGGGLSTGAIVGVVIGCLIAGILLCLGVFLIIRQYRRRRMGKAGRQFGSELPGESAPSRGAPATHYYGPPKELHSTASPAELPAPETGQWRHELSANSPVSTRQY